MPKSSSLTSPSVVTSTLEGLMSRWTIRLAWACATAANTSRKRRTRALHIELVLVAIPIDRFAINVFEDEIRLAIGGNAGIEEVGNVRMRKPAKDAAFAFESFFSRAPGERNVHELHRSLPLEPAVAATREPDAAHSALANLRNQGVGTKCLARKSRGDSATRIACSPENLPAPAARCSLRSAANCVASAGSCSA